MRKEIEFKLIPIYAMSLFNDNKLIKISLKTLRKYKGLFLYDSNHVCLNPPKPFTYRGLQEIKL